jgi:hypothetical protein
MMLSNEAADRVCAQSIGKNRLIAMFGRRLGRLQRQCHYAFIALGGEARTSELAEWCRPRLIILERGKPTRVQIASHARAARSIGACRVRRVSGQWVWRLTHTEPES